MYILKKTFLKRVREIKKKLIYFKLSLTCIFAEAAIFFGLFFFNPNSYPLHYIQNLSFNREK